MRPRPFRFFFAFSLGLILFFFFARFVILALIMAAAFSFIFFLTRKIKRFFQRLSWQEDDYYEPSYRSRRQLPVWKDDLLMEYPTRRKEYISNYRNIEVL